MGRITAQIINTWNTIELTVTLRAQVEIVFHGSLNSEILSPIGRNVEVHLQDLRLGILLCQANGQRCLHNLTIERLLRIAGEIFDHLLGNSTASALNATRLSILGSCTQNALWVYAGV